MASKLLDMCKCSCGWQGKVSECQPDEEQDGWENPTYKVDLCPSCGMVIDDYWPSSLNDS